MPRPVALAPYTSNWAVRAAELIAVLHATAPGVFQAVHHIGSTAVPGLSAKPVIDLLGETGSLAMIDAARPALEGLGYRWRGENGWPVGAICPGTIRRPARAGSTCTSMQRGTPPWPGIWPSATD